MSTDTRTPRFEPSQVIAGRFEILRALSTPESGDVYLVRETEHDKEMWLKHLNIPPAAANDAYEGLLQEVKDASAVKHRNLAQVYGLAREGDDLFLASEAIDGQTISAYLQSRRDQNKGPLTPKAAFNLINNLCEAVALAHDANLIHGALTPDRIYITSTGRVKITDLVYARILSRHLPPDQRAALFNSPFLPPEVRSPDSSPRFQSASDVYAIGMLATQLLSPRALESWPSDPQSFVEDTVTSLSPSLQAALLNAVTPDPAQRPQSIQRFQARIKEAQGDDTTSGSAVMSLISAEDLKNIGTTPKAPPPKPKGPPPPKSTDSVAMRLPPKSGENPAPKSSDSVAMRMAPAPTGPLPAGPPPMAIDPSKSLSVNLKDLPPPKSGSLAMPLPAPKQGMSFLDALPEPRNPISSISNIVSDTSQEIWLVQKDGLDYGPFGVQGVLDMLYKDDIDENASVLNMLSDKRFPLIELPEFNAAVVAYLPKRQEKRLAAEADRERRAKQVKVASGAGAGVGLAIGAVFAVSAILVYISLPDPLPIEYGKAFAHFERSLPLTRSEEVKMDLDSDKLKGLLDPNASEAERLARLQALREEQRKKLLKDSPTKKSGPRRTKPRKSAASAASSSDGGDEGEYVSEMNMESDADTLDDVEIFDVVYGDRLMGKLMNCVSSYNGSSFSVSFWIRASNGSLARLKVKSSGNEDFKNCVYDVYNSSVSFREFGGSDKQATIPYNL